jgi:Ca-activated chloride channel homolog
LPWEARMARNLCKGSISAGVVITFILLIGFLFLVAVPIFKNHKAKAITTEARTNIRKIYDGEIAFFDSQQSMKHFVSAGPEPMTPTNHKQQGNWNDPAWQALRFGSNDPVYYSYTAVADGEGLTASFTARAEGDIDGDGKFSLFERVATVDQQTGNIVGGSGLYVENDTESYGMNPIARRLMGRAERFGQTGYKYQPSSPVIDPYLRHRQDFNTESYDHVGENPFVRVSSDPLSTFSIDVDTASYSNMRRFIESGSLPPKDSVRIEELVNYFTYAYEPPAKGEPFAVHVDAAGAPWNPNHRLVRIGIKGKEIAANKRPASNLVFLIDVSGSMCPENKLPLVIKSMKMLVERLNENDRIAIVVYAGASGVVLPSTSAKHRKVILAALEQLNAGGSTNGGQGIQLAYQIAEENFIPRGTNRVILATDGDFNVGITNQADLIDLIEEKAKSDIFLSVLGFGMGNLKDSTLEKLADNGNGNYAYIDTETEAKKVLVEQMGGTLVTIAKDVKIQVEFNPEQIHAFRLIGYENRVLQHQDFNNDKKDAGEIGAGHTVTALYEVVPTDQEVETSTVDPLKYQSHRRPKDPSQEWLNVKIRYKAPTGKISQKLEFPFVDRGMSMDKASADLKFAASVAEFGMLLRDSEHKGNATFEMAEDLAKEGLGKDKNGYRKEFVKLIEKAERLSKRRISG